MAKADLVKKCTDEFLLQQILLCKKQLTPSGEPAITHNELLALESMLESVRRWRPITMQRGKLAARQREQVESKFKALGLVEVIGEDGLRANKKIPAGQAKKYEPLAGIPDHMRHPIRPPNRLPHAEPGLKFFMGDLGPLTIETCDPLEIVARDAKGACVNVPSEKWAIRYVRTVGQ